MGWENHLPLSTHLPWRAAAGEFIEVFSVLFVISVVKPFGKPMKLEPPCRVKNAICDREGYNLTNCRKPNFGLDDYLQRIIWGGQQFKQKTKTLIHHFGWWRLVS